jgi:hypothetical protein
VEGFEEPILYTLKWSVPWRYGIVAVTPGVGVSRVTLTT